MFADVIVVLHQVFECRFPVIVSVLTLKNSFSWNLLPKDRQSRHLPWLFIEPKFPKFFSNCFGSRSRLMLLLLTVPFNKSGSCALFIAWLCSELPSCLEKELKPREKKLELSSNRLSFESRAKINEFTLVPAQLNCLRFPTWCVS